MAAGCQTKGTFVNTPFQQVGDPGSFVLCHFLIASVYQQRTGSDGHDQIMIEF